MYPAILSTLDPCPKIILHTIQICHLLSPFSLFYIQSTSVYAPEVKLLLDDSFYRNLSKSFHWAVEIRFDCDTHHNLSNFFLEELYIVSVIDLNIMGSIQIIKEMCKITISVDSTSLPLLMTIVRFSSL